ncbi:MAG: DsrE family protein [Thiotrichales bacterium]|nr:DsrE family protein [Thiotrichales bacterium]
MVNKITRFVMFILAVLSITGGCSDNEDVAVTANTVSVAENSGNGPSNTPDISPPTRTQLTIGNKQYFFDVADHTAQELQALLERIEEIIEASPETFDELEIVMVLHGPDIGLFTQSNYEQNQKLIDLAAKLDAFNVVDMKACETSMDSLGVKKSDIPPFIETVPYAPSEIRRLKNEGYINL